MKILVVTRSLDQRVGGLENHTIQMCRGLQRFGWDITIITPNLKQNVPSTIHDNFNIQRLGKAPSDLLKYSPRLWRKISKFIKRNSDDFDVIINVGMALGGAFRLTNSQKNKLITIDHGTYALERKTLYSQIKMNKFEIKLWLGIPYTYIFQQIERGVINRSRFVIAVSDNIANDLRKRYELNNEKLYTIYNAVDTKYFKYKKRDFNKPLSLLFLARVHRQKGIYFLVDSFIQLNKDRPDMFKNIKMYIAGEGPALAEIKRSTKRYNNIKIMGRVEYSKVKSVYNKNSILVFPSLGKEGTAYSILEAMATGMPCLASDINGPNEVIDSGMNGYLFKAGDYEDFSLKLRKLINNRENLIKSSKKARLKIEYKFSIEKQLEAIRQIVLSVHQ